jgi:hypothetical protein
VAVAALAFFLAPQVFASSGNISTTQKYAFSNVGGYVNFATALGNVTVNDNFLSGYAWSTNDGWINLNPSQGGVHNDGKGTLSGFAWDQTAGWINFSGVTIDTSGVFHGQATGGTVNGAGYILNFDCSNCNVVTDWRPSTGAFTPGSISFTTIVAPHVVTESPTSTPVKTTLPPPPSSDLVTPPPPTVSEVTGTRGTTGGGGAKTGVIPSQSGHTTVTASSTTSSESGPVKMQEVPNATGSSVTAVVVDIVRTIGKTVVNGFLAVLHLFIKF